MDTSNKLAPIVLFVYNRLDYTKKTIEALQANQLASESILFIYSDAAKDENDAHRVSQVREYIKTIDGFKSVIISKRENNWGLADSIIDGVSKVVEKYGKIIVLEDDLVTSPSFLKFTNEALDFYEDHKKVWHISGWNYPIETTRLEDVFLWRCMSCWGWATWSDRWEYFEKNIDKTVKDFSRKQIKYFNLDNYENYWSQIIANKENKINTWAVFWYATIIKHKGLCLNPAHSFVINIGNDGSGEHRDSNNTFLTTLSKTNKFNFTSDFQENLIAVDLIKKFYKSIKTPLLMRITNKFKRMLNKTIKSLS